MDANSQPATLDPIEKYRALLDKSPLLVAEARTAIVALFAEVDRLRGRVNDLLVSANWELEHRREVEWRLRIREQVYHEVEQRLLDAMEQQFQEALLSRSRLFVPESVNLVVSGTEAPR